MDLKKRNSLTILPERQCLSVFIGHLRKTIDTAPSMPSYILIEPWIGYRFNPGRLAEVTNYV